MTGKDGNGQQVDTLPVWLTGAKAIAAAVGVDHRDVPELVRVESFPAFKYRGRWRAIPEEVSKWSRGMAKKRSRKRQPKSNI